jgi:biopolymer transport protein ExbD
VSFTQREARAIIRKAVGRVPEGEEIRHLNIMPMMDMMTILLVSFIAQAASSATDVAARSVQLPPIPSNEEIPDETTTLVITRNAIVVEGKPVVSVTNGQVGCGDKEGGCLGHKITNLTTFLARLHAGQLAKAAERPNFNKDDPKLNEIMIIADRTTPYMLLIEVMFSAKQTEAGYKTFRMIVEKAVVETPR